MKYLPVMIGLFFGAAAAQAERPIEDFAALPAIESPKLSPSGTAVAMAINREGEQMLVISPLISNGKAAAAINVGDNDLNWWTWVNDDWLVAGVGGVKNMSAGEDWYITRAVAVSSDGTKIKWLVSEDAGQNADDIIWTAKDGSANVLLAYQSSIYYEDEGFFPQVDMIDLASGKKKVIVKPVRHVSNWYADGNGVVRIGIGTQEGSRMMRLLYRKTNNDLFKTVERAFLGKDQSLLVPHIFGADGTTAITVAEKEGFDGVFSMNLQTFELGEKIHGLPNYDVSGVHSDRSGTQLTGIAYTDQRSRVRWVDPIIADVQQALEQSVPGKDVRLMSMDDAHTVFIAKIGAASAPGSFYLFDKRTAKMQRFGFANDRIKGASLAPVKSVRFAARDGVEIEAILTLPKDRPTNKLPFIVMPHGGPFARDEESWDWWAQFLADRGYAVLQPNYRGSSGYGSEFAKKGAGQWGMAMQDDLDDAVQWAVEQSIADPARVCIVGASYGGYAAMRAAERGGRPYRCAVSYAGVSDLKVMRRYDGQFLNGRFATEWLREQAPDLDAVSPIKRPQNFAIPILLVHGKKDRRVPYKQSASLAEKLQKAGKSVRYVEQPLGDHHFTREADRIEFLTELEKFLDAQNPADSPITKAAAVSGG